LQMFANWRILLCFCSLFFMISAEQWWETGISLKLKTADFDKYVGKDKHVVIEFYAQFCHWCKSMNGEWDKLAEHYMVDDAKRKDVIIAKMDGSVEKAIATRYGITTFPAVVIFKKGEIFPTDRFNNQRTFEIFKSWIEQQAGVEVILKPTESELEKDEKTEKIEKPKLRSFLGGNLDGQVGELFEKLDSLTESGNISKPDELKTVLKEINRKLSESEEATAAAGINFSHGLTFLFLGVFLGVGASFTFINYQKLNKRKKMYD